MVDKKYRSEYTGEEIDAAVTKINALDLNNYYDKSDIDLFNQTNVKRGNA